MTDRFSVPDSAAPATCNDRQPTEYTHANAHTHTHTREIHASFSVSFLIHRHRSRKSTSVYEEVSRCKCW